MLSPPFSRRHFITNTFLIDSAVAVAAMAGGNVLASTT
ncbi:twin-arginine translocation signal domain-containing protein [Hymenobacter sp. BT190]|nr:twin-arginine translocation signal domain-containing protein [Hymenobacter sp. BT190]